jgi:succinyl-diaminopimelate desuccinylase
LRQIWPIEVWLPPRHGHGMNLTDPVALTQALIKCPSVTPQEGGALDLLQSWLVPLGFTCTRLPFGDGAARVDNLYARLGSSGPHLCYAGHTDVVPPGELAQWSSDPFTADIRNGFLTGRGAADMKGSIAAFVSATAQAVAAGAVKGSLSFLITGDEEGPAQYGTTKVLDWMDAQAECPDHCLVGEPTSARKLGDMAKIGRRGSMNAHITVLGAQGHVAYPDRADNPVTRLVAFLHAVKARLLDSGNAHFQPSNLEVTDMQVGNATENMIPAHAKARLNIRFNTEHSGATLSAWLKELLTQHAPNHDLQIRISGEAFLSPPGKLSTLVREAVRAVTGVSPELSTTGGTSDARFIQRLCPVIEFGLVGQTMHKIDEHVAVDDIHTLRAIYANLIESYYA